MARPTPLRSVDRPAGESSTQRFESLLRALPAGVVVLDRTGCIQEANPAATALLGLPLVGEPWRDVAARSFEPGYQGEDLKLRSGRFVHLTTCPLGAAPGQILHLQDTTETRRLRTRLEHARRLADMGRMAASLAHQVRTPLAAALLYGGHLRRTDLPADKRVRFAGKLVDRLHHLEALIRNMLVFARGGDAQMKRIDTAELVRAVVEGSAEAASARQAELRLEPGGAVAVMGNPIMLQSALQNLVTNALEAVGQGGRVEVAVRSGPADSVEIRVEDDGPGIPSDLQSRIFQPFFTTREGGNGLGLAVVAAVVRACGGAVRAESQPGAGSTFVLSLPRAPDTVVANVGNG